MQVIPREPVAFLGAVHAPPGASPGLSACAASFQATRANGVGEPRSAVQPTRRGPAGSRPPRSASAG